MSLQSLYNELESGGWSDINPFICECKGSGWLLSDLDTWHKCNTHYSKNIPCREDFDNCDLSEKEIQEYNELVKSHFVKNCVNAIDWYLEDVPNSENAKLTLENALILSRDSLKEKIDAAKYKYDEYWAYKDFIDEDEYWKKRIEEEDL